jgi:D-cysteine desulfhydrase
MTGKLYGRLFFIIFIFLTAITCISDNREQELIKHFMSTIDQKPSSWIAHLNDCGILSTPPDRSLIPPLISYAPLFEKYPTLLETLPYVSLGNLPTAVKKIGHLYVKQDGLSSFTADTFGRGGTIVRSLEFLFAEALAHKARTLILAGSAGSSNVLTASAYAEKLDFSTIGMVTPPQLSRDIRNNLLMHLLYKTKFHYSSTDLMQRLACGTEWLNHYYHSGSFPYLMNVDDPSSLGAVGFVNAAFELRKQIREGILPRPDFIYIQSQSPSLIAGLLLGIQAAGIKSMLVGLMRGSELEFESIKKEIAARFDALKDFIRKHDPSFPECVFDDHSFMLDQLCDGDFTFESFCKSSLSISPTKTPADLHMPKTIFMDEINHHLIQGKVILIWNTFSTIDYSKHLADKHYSQLPNCLHQYFTASSI